MTFKVPRIPQTDGHN